MRIPEMCLKQSFSHYKCILNAILSLTVLSNCVSDSSNFDSTFFPNCTKFCSVFLRHWMGNLMRNPKLCLIILFCHSKCILHAILSLTVTLNCVSVSSNFGTTFLSDGTKF